MGIAKTRARRIAASLCRDCGGWPLAPAKVICVSCSDKRSARQAARAEKLKEIGICLQCKGKAEPSKTLCKQCSEIAIDDARHRRKRNKLVVIQYFGGKCECGESHVACLSVDHINNNGNIDCAGPNKRISSPQWYARLYKQINEGIELTGLQLLCFNCHAKKDLAPWWIKEL